MTNGGNQALCFIVALATYDPVTFQTFDERFDKKSLNRILHGTFKQHQSNLEALNNEGAGIFVTVNESDGNGRSNAGVVRIRAVFIDTDGADFPSNLPLEPHIVVRTSPGRWHIYWLVEGVALDDFGDIQAALAEKYGTDPTITDRCRVMRIPGFYHHKREPAMVQLLCVRNTAPYTAAQVFTAWPEIAERVERERDATDRRKQEATMRRAEAERRHKDDRVRSLDEKRAQGILRATCDRVATTTGNRNTALLKAARAMGGYVAGNYLTEGEVTDALTLAAEVCGLEAKEIPGCVSRGISYGLAHPLYLAGDLNGRDFAAHSPGKTRSRRSRVFARMKRWGNGNA